jgi:hypothetical protein
MLDIYSSTDHIEDLDVEAYKEAVEELHGFHSLGVSALNLVPLMLENIGSMDDDEEWDCYIYFVVEEVEDE